MGKRLFLLWMVILLVVAGCGMALAGSGGSKPANQDIPQLDAQDPVAVLPEKHTLTVFAAASLTGAFQEIGEKYEASHPGITISFNFAGSQILRTQIEQGAVVDVFASADHKNMDLLLDENLIDKQSYLDFVTNRLVVILPDHNPGEVQTLADLSRPGMKLVLADGSVPAGNYARQVLMKMSQDKQYGDNFYDRVLANVVSNETDVKQVVTKVELGEADAGIVYVSDAVAAANLETIPIPAAYNVIASYPIAIPRSASEPSLAANFIAYVISKDGQEILTRWGFNPMAH